MNKLKLSANEKSRSFLKNIDVLIFLIVLLGLILRLVGTKHGFPFIFHPDEPTIVRSALGVRFESNPKHFDWPHLYIYLNYFLYIIFAKIRTFIVDIGLRDRVIQVFPLMWDEGLIYYYLTRCFSAILGALTAVPVFLASKNLFGRKIGILSALAMTLMPYHVWHSHYALGDVPMVFFLSWGLYFSILIMRSPTIKNYILSGFFIGLSASVKYNGGLSALMVPLAHFIRIFKNKGSEKKDEESKIKKILKYLGIVPFFISGFSALLGFLIGTPYALLDYNTFSIKNTPQGAFWQFSNVGKSTFPVHLGKYFTETFSRLLIDTGYIVIPVFALSMCFVFYKIIRKKAETDDKHLMFLYLILLLFIWYLSGFENNKSHYYFIVYPFLAIIFGYFAGFFGDVIKRIFKVKSKSMGILISSIAVFLLFSPLITKSLINSYRYYRNDTRIFLYQWMIENYVPGEQVLYNDKDVRNIFGKIGINAVQGIYGFKEFDKSMIIIVARAPVEDKFLNKNGKLLEEVVRFDGKLRLGPDIEIYRYEK